MIRLSHPLLCVVTVLAVYGLSAAPAWAAPPKTENAGQTALDEATEAKLTAESISDLGTVVRLCHQALEAGLDTANTEFAKNLLAGTLLLRAEAICNEIFGPPTPPSRWSEMRRLALSDLEESLEVKPDEPDAHFLAARLQALPGGERERAVKAVDEAVRLSEKEPLVRAKALALRATLSGDLDKRRADLDEAARLAPHNTEVLRSRGVFLIEQNELEAALESLNAAVAANPNQADTYDARGVALFMLKRYGEAMQDFDKVIEMVPNSPLVYTHRARIYALEGKYKEALAETDAALALDPEFSVALMLRARLYLQAGDLAKAMADVNGVLRKDPDDIQTQLLRAQLLAGSGKINEAIDGLEQVRPDNPKNAELLLALGMLYAASQQVQKSIDAYTAAIEHSPNNWIAYRSRGDAYLNVSKQAAAVADYEEALKLDPENSGVLNNLAWVLATSPDEKLRDGKRSIELGQLACKLTDYKQAHILSTLAAGYAEAGDFESAINWSTKAVEAGDEPMKEQLRKELASYKAGKPWREAVPPGIQAKDDDSTAEKTEAAPAAGAASNRPASSKRR